MWLVGNLVTTRRVLLYRKGPEMFLWLAVIWGIPCIGSLVAFFAVKKLPATTIEIPPPGPSTGPTDPPRLE